MQVATQGDDGGNSGGSAFAMEPGMNANTYDDKVPRALMIVLSSDFNLSRHSFGAQTFHVQATADEQADYGGNAHTSGHKVPGALMIVLSSDFNLSQHLFGAQTFHVQVATADQQGDDGGNAHTYGHKVPGALMIVLSSDFNLSQHSFGAQTFHVQVATADEQGDDGGNSGGNAFTMEPGMNAHTGAYDDKVPRALIIVLSSDLNLSRHSFDA